MMYRPSSFHYLVSVLDLLLKPQLAYRMAPAISKHAHRPSPSDVCLPSIVCDMVPCTGTRACLHSQMRRRGRRKSAWYTLFAHALNRAILCLLVAGYLETMLKKEQVASNECVYRRNMRFMRLSINFCKSIPTTAYQTSLCTRQYKTRQRM